MIWTKHKTNLSKQIKDLLLFNSETDDDDDDDDQDNKSSNSSEEMESRQKEIKNTHLRIIYLILRAKVMSSPIMKLMPQIVRMASKDIRRTSTKTMTHFICRTVQACPKIIQ